MTTLSEFATELLRVETERDQFFNTLVEIRQILGITDNEVWTQDVLRELTEKVAQLDGGSADLSIVKDEEVSEV